MKQACVRYGLCFIEHGGQYQNAVGIFGPFVQAEIAACGNILDVSACNRK
jgi:hypothetical protein